MNKWQVILLRTETTTSNRVAEIRTFGPYDSEEQAEQGRRRVHFQFVAGAASWEYGRAKTYITQTEAPR